MKKHTKFGIFCLASILALSALIPMVVSKSTTIDDSTYPASEGESYKWTCTYCNEFYDDLIGEGSYRNVTIETIVQGSYIISNALIVSGIEGVYLKGTNSHSISVLPYLCVYNASLQFVYLNFLFIVPIPLNLSMIADSIGGNTTIMGNTLIIEDGSSKAKYNYNSGGFCTSWIYELDGERAYTFSLKDGAIPLGNYFIIPTSITIAVIVIIIKKRHSIK